MAAADLEKEFMAKVKLPVPKFVIYSTMVKDIARLQLKMDKSFRNDLFRLRRQMYKKKITPKQFWKDYKKLILKSIVKNTKTVKELLNKADVEMERAFKKAEKEEKKESKNEKRPPIDLRLPQ